MSLAAVAAHVTGHVSFSKKVYLIQGDRWQRGIAAGLLEESAGGIDAASGMGVASALAESVMQIRSPQSVFRAEDQFVCSSLAPVGCAQTAQSSVCQVVLL